MFLLRLSLRPWRLAPLSQLFSAFAVGFLLLLAGFLYWIQTGLGPVVARLQGEQVVTAYLDASIGKKDEPRIVDSIRAALGAHAQASEVSLVGSREFIDRLRGPYPERRPQLQELGPEETGAVVPRYVSVAGVFPDQALGKIRAVQGIESAESSKNRYAHVVGAFLALRWVAKALMAGLCMALLTGLIHLARMNTHFHRDALSVLRLWGAGEPMARAPGLISGTLVGALGGVFALGGWLAAFGWMEHRIRELSPLLGDLPPGGAGVAAGLCLAGIAIGVLAGALGGSSPARHAEP